MTELPMVATVADFGPFVLALASLLGLAFAFGAVRVAFDV